MRSSSLATTCVAVGLFAFIPLVLTLLLRLPLGGGPSLLLAVVLMIGHRRVAAPWVAKHGDERCLWCGQVTGQTMPLRVLSADREWQLSACGENHAQSASRLLGYLERHRRWIGFGIFVPLLLLLGGTLATVLGRPILEHHWLRLIFQLLVASTVLTVSLSYFRTTPSNPLRSPFPLHNLCLLGMRNTLWVFRLVGCWWLLSILWAAFRH